MSPSIRPSPLVRHAVLVTALLVLLGLSAVLAARQPAAPSKAEPPPAPGGAASPAPATKLETVPPPSRFEAVDVIIDAGKQPLAAWQVELTGAVAGGKVRIVGVEGGESPPYAKAPYFDPRAMSNDRVIVAALSTAPAPELPSGRTRVARVHIQVAGSLHPAQYTVRLMAAANPNAEPIAAAVTATTTVTPAEKRP